MESKKTTKKEFFTMLKTIVGEYKPTNETELIGFIDHELELLDRKASNRKAGTDKKAVENNTITNLVIEELRKTGKTTITDLLKKSEVLANYVTEDGKALSNQKLSALLKPLYSGENPCIIRTMDKRITYFQVIE